MKTYRERLRKLFQKWILENAPGGGVLLAVGYTERSTRKGCLFALPVYKRVGKFVSLVFKGSENALCFTLGWQLNLSDKEVC